MTETNETNKTNPIDLLPEKEKSVSRNDTTITFKATLGKRRDWEGVPYYQADVDGTELNQLVKWVGEDITKKVLGRYLNTTAQEAMYRATHRPGSEKDADGNPIDVDQPFDDETWTKSISDLRMVGGRTLAQLEDDLKETLAEFAICGAKLEEAKAAGNMDTAMELLSKCMKLSQEVTNIQEAKNSRRRPRGED